MSKPRTYNPDANYNQQGGEAGVSINRPGSANSSNPYVGPLLAHNIQGAPNIWRIAAVLDGNVDARYKYTLKSSDFQPGGSGQPIVVFQLKLPHGLSYTPTVEASMTLQTDKKRRQLPYIRYNAGDASFGAAPNLYVLLDTIDDTYIYINIVIEDILGLSLMLANTIIFKFYCFADGTVA